MSVLSRTAILVSGVNYAKAKWFGKPEEKDNRGSLRFDKQCGIRARYLASKRPDIRFTFIWMDAYSGTVTRWSGSHGPPTHKAQQAFAPVKREMYTKLNEDYPEFIKEKGAGVMSMTDVYAAIKSEGAKQPIFELSIFSHGWRGGPVLVNSFEDPKYYNASQRDPNDKDSRLKDFVKSEASFGAAFDHVKTNGRLKPSIRLWGCRRDPAVLSVTRRFVKGLLSPPLNWQPHEPLAIDDKQTILFDFNDVADVDYESHRLTDTEFFPIVAPGAKVFNRTWAEIRAYYERRLAKDNYARAIADAAALGCHSAAPGTGSAREVTSTGTRRFMSVGTTFPWPFPRNLRKDPGRAEDVVEFFANFFLVTLYRDYLSVEFNEQQYAVYAFPA